MGYNRNGIGSPGSGLPLKAPGDIEAWKETPRLIRPSDLGKIVAIPPWDVDRMPTSKGFFSIAKPSLTLPAGVGATVQATLATGGAFKVPSNNVAALKLVSIFCNAPDLTTNITYIVRQQGAPIPGLDSLGFAPRAAASVQIDFTDTQQIHDGALIDVLIVNNAATGPWTVSVTIGGWFVPASDVFNYTGQRPGMIA